MLTWNKSKSLRLMMREMGFSQVSLHQSRGKLDHKIYHPKKKELLKARTPTQNCSHVDYAPPSLYKCKFMTCSRTNCKFSWAHRVVGVNFWKIMSTGALEFGILVSCLLTCWLSAAPRDLVHVHNYAQYRFLRLFFDIPQFTL